MPAVSFSLTFRTFTFSSMTLTRKMRNEYAGNNEKALTTDGKDKSRVHLTIAEIASVLPLRSRYRCNYDTCTSVTLADMTNKCHYKNKVPT